MKKLILVFVSIVIAAGAYAQTDSTNKNMSPRDKNNKQYQTMQKDTVDKSTDGFVMLNGKMMKMKNGESTILDTDLTMNNGTQIMSDGTCIKKDGTRMMLKEGQRMDLEGNIIKNDKNMYLVPDSIRK